MQAKVAHMTQSNTNQPTGSRRFELGVSDFSTSEPLANAQLIIESGMDFIEPGLAKIAAMTTEDFELAASGIKEKNIQVKSANWFLPADLKVVGPNADDEKSKSFLEHALQRAATLGARAVVFGSPGSRTIPDSFSAEMARQQLINFCQLAADVIKDHGWQIRIALEHVNHTETNFINTFAQALSVAREVDRPEIGLAADFYHFAMESEDMGVMRDAGDLICAVQLADPNGRCFPGPDAEIPGLDQFLKILDEIGYRGGVSVEATVGDDLAADCRGAAERLSKIIPHESV